MALLAAPAFADNGRTAYDQGYPCATQPAGSEGCTTCAPDQVMTNGVCAPCPPDQVMTNGVCAPCPPDQAMQNGVCAPTLTPSAPVGDVAGTSVVTLTPSSGTLGAQKTVSRAAPARHGVSPLRTTRTTGVLPFTGAQLSIFAIVGLLLIGGGLVLRTTSRRPGSNA